MKVLQINTIVNKGSTGRIAEEVGLLLTKYKHDCLIAYGRSSNISMNKSIKIGSQLGVYFHVIKTRLLDKHGLASSRATLGLIDEIRLFNPDIIHLHNIHGYYLNYRILFGFIQKLGIPVVWTLHDCWAFTGHCAYFSYINCDKWKTECFRCPNLGEYPSSILFDNSKSNYNLKKKSFTAIANLYLVPVSNWLSQILEQSFFKNMNKVVIHNGIDVTTFKPTVITQSFLTKYSLSDKFIVLGVASDWSRRKGLDEFVRLYKLLDANVQIVLIGLNKKQINKLPLGIKALERTDNIEELVQFYSVADVFVNPTFEDNYPTTNLEALACGTPVITYNTGGSPESLTSDTGIVVEQGDILALHSAILCVKNKGKNFYLNSCRNHATANFNKDDRFKEYINLYLKILNNE